MPSKTVTQKVRVDDYYSDGIALLRIMDVNSYDKTVLAENCLTYETEWITLEKLEETYIKIKKNASV